VVVVAKALNGWGVTQVSNGALGGLLKGATASFNQGREYNLAVADARASAALRLRTMQMEDERRALEEERLNIYREKVAEETKQAAWTRQQAKELRDKAKELAEELYPKPTGRDVTAGVQAGRKTDLTGLGRERAAGRVATELAPKAAAEKKLAGREMTVKPKHLPAGKYGYVDESGNVVVTGEIEGKPTTETQTDFDQYFDEYTQLMEKGEANWTERDKIRFPGLQQKVMGRAKTMSPIEMSNAVITQLSRYHGARWNGIPPEKKNDLINEKGIQYFGADWTEYGGDDYIID
jgi:hypothetical protein